MNAFKSEYEEERIAQQASREEYKASLAEYQTNMERVLARYHELEKEWQMNERKLQLNLQANLNQLTKTSLTDVKELYNGYDTWAAEVEGRIEEISREYQMSTTNFQERRKNVQLDASNVEQNSMKDLKERSDTATADHTNSHPSDRRQEDETYRGPFVDGPIQLQHMSEMDIYRLRDAKSLAASTMILHDMYKNRKIEMGITTSRIIDPTDIELLLYAFLLASIPNLVLFWLHHRLYSYLGECIKIAEGNQVSDVVRLAVRWFSRLQGLCLLSMLVDLDGAWRNKGFYVLCQIVVLRAVWVTGYWKLPPISSEIIRIWICSLWPLVVERMVAYVFAILMEKQVQNKYL